MIAHRVSKFGRVIHVLAILYLRTKQLPGKDWQGNKIQQYADD